MNQVDMVNHPPHYADTPEGVGLECIEYTRMMPFAQGNAFKYVYRLGKKSNNQEDLDKAVFYIIDALDNGPMVSLDFDLVNTIEPCSDRTSVLADIATGELNNAHTMLLLIKTSGDYDSLDRRYDK